MLYGTALGAHLFSLGVASPRRGKEGTDRMRSTRPEYSDPDPAERTGMTSLEYGGRPAEGGEPDDAIRAIVTRLSRPHASGGDVIERAAILAEGANSAAIVAWIVAHAGQPEAAVPQAPARGLHGARLSGGPGAAGDTPRRYVLPVGALT
jgi:hypothetical protein